MAWYNIKELDEKRAKAVEDAGAILKRANEEKRELTTEENTEWDAYHAEADKCKECALMVSRQDEADKGLVDAIGKESKPETPETRSEKDTEKAFKRWMQFGEKGITPEERSLVQNNSVQLRTVSGLGDSSYGGEFIPTGISGRFVESLKWFGGLRPIANVFTTAGGESMTIPTTDDTGCTGELVGLNTDVTDDHTYDVATNSATLATYKFSSMVQRVPVELLQDSAFDVAAWLNKALVTRLGRISNAYETTGTGSSQPGGVAYQASSGKTFASTTAITALEIYDLIHEVDKAYRESPSTALMQHDSTLKAMKKLVDENGAYIWRRGSIADKAPDTFDGYPVVTNCDMAELGAGNTAMLFGDFSYFWIRLVQGVQMVRFGEKYMNTLQIGFLAWVRSGSVLTNTSAVKKGASAAS